MKALVVYDSAFGNTQKVAEAIGAALSSAEVRHVDQVKPENLHGLECLIVGSPTQKMNFTDGMRNFLDRIPPTGLAGVQVAAFDTRISNEDMRALVRSSATRLVVKVFLHRFAAGPIAGVLKKKGGIEVMAPEGFFVSDTQGPLKAGELERAAAWAQRLMHTVSP
jgi:menaquinone-dependent protoporphyrinogen IX oxidase